MLHVSDFCVENHFATSKVPAVTYFTLKKEPCCIDLCRDLVLSYVAFLCYVFNKALSATSLLLVRTSGNKTSEDGSWSNLDPIKLWDCFLIGLLLLGGGMHSPSALVYYFMDNTYKFAKCNKISVLEFKLGSIWDISGSFATRHI